MTGALGAGNERVYPGLDGWLFFRPDVEHVTGRPFLDPAVLDRRVRTTAEWDEPPRPDPRAGVLQFARELAARGVTLIVVPTPVKPGVHPEKLAGPDAEDAAPLHNPSYAAFIALLMDEGVLVFEPVQSDAPRGMEDRYLKTDTHWRPEFMEDAAARLATFVRAHVQLSDAGDPGHAVERAEIANRGDTGQMLDLPDASTLYPPETVWIRRVLRSDGSLWRSSPNADLLLLGDSFSNIYSLESMGWGTSAGFAEQLSYALRRPIDRLVQNDGGAFATREMLHRQPQRLVGKRVVVWQFAERELSFGNWKILALP
jgi:alginate O-acetyltransferase complex protein AlgJ